VYGVTFYVDGEPTGVGTFTIADGRAGGDVRGVNTTVTIEACVLPGGEVAFRVVQGGDGQEIGVAVVIDAGAIEGTYTLAGAEVQIDGIIEGSLNNRIDEDSHTEFDGIYDAQFSRAGEVVSTAVFEVDNSGFDGTIEASNGALVLTQGFVTSDGLIVLTGTSGSLLDVMGEGHIDHDSFEASGVYRFGQEAGVFAAQRRQP
jgi:hypothetical protein